MVPSHRCPCGFHFVPSRDGGYICTGAYHIINSRGEDNDQEYIRLRDRERARALAAPTRDAAVAIMVQFVDDMEALERRRGNKIMYIHPEPDEIIVAMACDMRLHDDYDTARPVRSFTHHRTSIKNTRHEYREEIDEWNRVPRANRDHAESDRREYDERAATNNNHRRQPASGNRRNVETEYAERPQLRQMEAHRADPERRNNNRQMVLAASSSDHARNGNHGSAGSAYLEEFDRERSEALARVRAVHSAPSSSMPR